MDSRGEADGALSDSKGQVQGYRCKNPSCAAVHRSVEEADRCLADRAQLLTEG